MGKSTLAYPTPALPEPLEQQFDDFVVKLEETKKMPYVTHIERRGIQQGLQQGLLQRLS